MYSNATVSETSALLERVIEAYGGAERWSSIKAVSLDVSAHGFAFKMKWQQPMRRVWSRVEVHRPLVRFESGWRNGLVGVFTGSQVRLERPDGTVVDARSEPKQYFPGGRRLLFWDDLDQIYFAGYALWNYITFPALLSNPIIQWEQTGSGTLRAHFPRGFPTHSQTQEFHFDGDTGLLEQHDYTAEVFGAWAKGAHRVLEHKQVDGLTFGTHRRVTPRRANGTAAPFPLLVGIEFDAITVED